MKITTPRGCVYHTKSGKAVLKWNPDFSRKWNNKYTNAQKFVDSEVLRLSDKYIPFKTGFLKKSGILGTDIGSGTVEWIAPYARYLYYGKVMVGKAPKKVTDIDLVYIGGPQRGSFWFERMKIDHKQEIINGAKRRM